MQKNRVLQIAVGTAGVALLAGACSSSSDDAASPSPATTTAAPTPTATGAPTPTTAPTATAAPATDAPAAPDGSKELQNKTENGVQYARYSNGSETPEEVNSYYKSTVEADGYKVTQSGGSGGGWGGYGGSDYGLSAEKSGSYVAVQSGGEKNGPTYFEVCLGADKSAVDECEKHSKDSNSGGS